MHELFLLVLTEKDLSKAGDLFSLDDKDVEDGLTDVLHKMRLIADVPQYLQNDNDQSVVEICITRVTSAIRENGSIEKHTGALVALLESCLRHDLKPTAKDEDPPHAKIASDVMSCIFLNYMKKSVMDQTLPVAVQFLEQDNKELVRNLSSYLSLAAIDNAKLLALHVEPILQSVIRGNSTLTRVLPQVYAGNKEPVHESISSLIALLPEAAPSDKNNLLQLIGLVAKDKPRLLEKHIAQLSVLLSSTATAATTLQIFVDMATTNPEPFVSQLTILKQTAGQQPAMLGLVAAIFGAVGKTSQTQAKSCLAYLVGQLVSADHATVTVLLREVKTIADVYPSLLLQHIAEISKCSESSPAATRTTIQQLKELCARSPFMSSPPGQKTAACQTEGIVTVITLGDTSEGDSKTNPTDCVTVYSPRPVAMVPDCRHASTSTQEICFPGGTVMSVVSNGNSPLVVTGAGTFPKSSQNVTVPTVAMGTTARISHSTVPSYAGAANNASRITLQTSVSPITTEKTLPVKAMVLGNKVDSESHDAVQQFCEKHLDKVKSYVDSIKGKLPIPIKATLDVIGSKKYCRLHFICMGRGDHCLYDHTFFTTKTKHSRIWIHVMFLAVQARSQKAVSQLDPSVANLKACWDNLKPSSVSSFVRLVTSAFPSSKVITHTHARACVCVCILMRS
ncbi:hypothetical protein NP493_199g02041 [Ridgeia piscesae]|uniref:Uncharacterized protein n=1 Tax=Ridgeia piscesae TaxID=27915 RepID=A0AAD9UEL1_RIDPI|nr:hypothetical protein NP493_199g02041 [Ridgeia piscesae]